MMQADLNQIISNAQIMEVTNDLEGIMQMDMEKEIHSGAAADEKAGVGLAQRIVELNDG